MATYSDAHIPRLRAVVIITDHTSFDYERIVERAHLIIDTRNALRHFKNENIVRL